MNQTVPFKPLILIALVQGLILLGLHQSIEYKTWLSERPDWLMALYAMTITSSLTLLLTLKQKNTRQTYIGIGVFAIITFALGFYNGWQLLPIKYVKEDVVIVSFCLVMGIATFKSVMYMQQRNSGSPLSYSLLFTLSWRNFLTVGLSCLFTLLLWGILMLWAGLFKAIGITFFYDLFIEVWFFYPILTMGFGFGIALFRNQSNIIDTITRIQQALMKFLLIILIFVSIIFLATLPFTGLKPLWGTGSGTTLILAMQAIVLFFVNAIYQDDETIWPYPRIMHRFVYIGVALMPVYSVISGYGLSLRILQYGWSVGRLWGMLIWFLLMLFSVGYCIGILKKKDHWISMLSWVNIRMGLVVLGFALLTLSPLLDFRKIALSSQLARLDSGKVTIETFDLSYLRRELARPGYLALLALKERYQVDKPELSKKIDDIIKNAWSDRNVHTKKSITERLKIVPEQQALPDDVVQLIFELVEKQPWHLSPNDIPYVLISDFNDDGINEYLLYIGKSHSGRGYLFYQENNQWKSARVSANLMTNDKSKKGAFVKDFKQHEIRIETPKWNDVFIDNIQLKIHDEKQ